MKAKFKQKKVKTTLYKLESWMDFFNNNRKSTNHKLKKDQDYIFLFTKGTMEYLKRWTHQDTIFIITRN